MPLVVSHRSGRVKTSIRQVSGDDLSHHDRRSHLSGISLILSQSMPNQSLIHLIQQHRNIFVQKSYTYKSIIMIDSSEITHLLDCLSDAGSGGDNVRTTRRIDQKPAATVRLTR